MKITVMEIHEHYSSVLRRHALPAEVLYWQLYPGTAFHANELRRDLASGKEFEHELFLQFRHLSQKSPSLGEIEACRALVGQGLALDRAVVHVLAET